LPARASCRRSPGKVIERFREIAARTGRLISGEHASAIGHRTATVAFGRADLGLDV